MAFLLPAHGVFSHLRGKVDFFRRITGLALILLTLAACAKRADGPTPSIPSGAPYSTVTPFLSERDRLLMAFGGAYQNQAVQSRLETILARLLAHAPELNRSFRLTLLNSPTPNAFALEDGDIFISRGLVAMSNDPAEIAAVMAHEL